MKKSLGVLSLMALVLGISASAQAQLFQNSNQNCEETTVLSIQGGSNSIACKNISGPALFNSDDFPDCALLTPNTDLGSPNVLSILMNLGSSATSCSSGTGDQFADAVNYAVTGLVPGSLGDLGSVVAGPLLSSSAFDDVAAPNTSTFGGNQNYATVPSVAGGGFGATNPIDTSATDVSFDFAGGPDISFSNDDADKTNALLDCNNDGAMDVAIIVKDDDAGDTFRVNFLINNGSGLQAASATADTGIQSSALSSEDVGALAVGDFNNDDNTDVAVTVSPSSGPLGGSSIVQVCTNNGSCGFTCQSATQVNLNDLHGGTDPRPTSIVAGDFNDDGNIDVAVNTPALALADRGVDFLFGNGSAAFSSNLVLAYTPENSSGIPVTLATGCFDNDNSEDVAVTYGSQVTSSARVGVFTDISSASAATTTLTFDGLIGSPGGIDSADFDNQGGDDILMVATDIANTANPRQAFVFMNSVETIVADAGSDTVMEDSGSTQLSGSCTVNPADASASFAPTWTILSPASGGSLTNATSLTPTFTATADGVYTLQLTCRTRCDDTATDTVVVTVGSGILEGSGVFLGGCSFNPLASFSVSGLGMMFASLSLFWGIRRRK